MSHVFDRLRLVVLQSLAGANLNPLRLHGLGQLAHEIDL
jgi:hypothetical protein